MAELNEIKVGDKLRLEGVVSNVVASDLTVAPVQLHIDIWRSDGFLWLSRRTIEAAEHIPAPKTFKRGDWVKLVSDDDYRGGLVVQDSISGETMVSWPLSKPLSKRLVLEANHNLELELDESFQQ